MSTAPDPSNIPPADEVAERPHPLTPLAKSWLGLVVLIGVASQQFGQLRSINLDVAQYIWVILGVIIVALLLGLAVGWLQWRFTRFVVSDEQLRIEHNFISKRSERIAFTKIQSVDVQQAFIPRLMGLAAVHIDVGSGNRPPKIEYLSRKRAYEMRDYLMHRASGASVTMAESSAVEVGDIFHDRSATDRSVIAIPAGRLVASLIATWGTVILLVMCTVGIILVVVTRSFGVLGVVASAVLPSAAGVVQYIVARVRNEWNFNLLVTSTGSLRTSAGLTSLVSQTIPRNRVQAISITQPILWRAFGWYRVRLDMVGMHVEGNQLKADVLLPVGTAEEVPKVIGALWPGFDLSAVPHNPSPSRARRIRWFDGHRLWWGSNADVLVAHHGWLHPTTSIVPHARVQSVRLRQGVVQRMLGLASVQAHTTPGPVDVVARHLQADIARNLAITELDLMRTARRHGPSWLGLGTDAHPRAAVTVPTEPEPGTPSMPWEPVNPPPSHTDADEQGRG